MTTRTSVDQYLATLPDIPRAALEEIRRTIRAAAPEATETISYGIPTVKQGGRLLISYAAFQHHCSLFPASGRVREACGDELAIYFSEKASHGFRIVKVVGAK